MDKNILNFWSAAWAAGVIRVLMATAAVLSVSAHLDLLCFMVSPG